MAILIDLVSGKERERGLEFEIPLVRITFLNLSLVSSPVK